MQDYLESKCLGNIKKFNAEKFQMVLHGSLELLLDVGLVIPNCKQLDAAPFGILGPSRLGLHYFALRNRSLVQHKDSKWHWTQMLDNLEFFFIWNQFICKAPGFLKDHYRVTL